MANVTKTGQGTAVQSTLVVKVVMIYLQHYPGIVGKDNDRGIGDVPYDIYHNGVKQKAPGAKSIPNGFLAVVVPSGVKVELGIFGSRYEINVIDSLEDLTSIKGYQRRLTILGYPIGGIDSDVGANTDAQVLNFQGDAGLDTFGPDGSDGKIDAKTQNKLKAAIGE